MNFKVEKEFESNGYKCYVVFIKYGHRCGYVEIPKEHKLFNKDYDEVNTENNIGVHGGITYSGEVYIKDDSSGTWCFGFDCAHCEDGSDYNLSYEYGLLSDEEYRCLRTFRNHREVRSLDYCIKECISLAEQLKELE